MGRVRKQSHLDLVFAMSSMANRAQVILDITRACIDGLCSLLWFDILKLSHDDFSRLSHYICKSVKSTSVSHSYDKITTTFFYGRVDEGFESRDERFTTSEAESLLYGEFFLHKSTPLICPIQSIIRTASFAIRQLIELQRLKLFTDPVANLTILDMHEMNADFGTIGLPVGFNEVPEHPLLLSLDNRAPKGHLNGKLTVHVSLCESVAPRIEQREELVVGEAILLSQAWNVTIDLLKPQRVQIGSIVPMGHESLQEHLKPGHFVRLLRLAPLLERSENALQVAASRHYTLILTLLLEVLAPGSVN